MKPNRMTIQNVGQITKAEIGFGDLTVFVGLQATGKSIALEFLKLLVDSGPVRTRLREYGVEWDRDLARFFDIFLGEGMNRVWHEGTSTLAADGAKVDIAALIKKPGQLKKDPSMFFLPAQCVLTLREGWPRPFSDYGPGDPFVVRDFSDNLRLLMEKEFGRSDVLFPKSRRRGRRAALRCRAQTRGRTERGPSCGGKARGIKFPPQARHWAEHAAAGRDPHLTALRGTEARHVVAGPRASRPGGAAIFPWPAASSRYPRRRTSGSRASGATVTSARASRRSASSESTVAALLK